MGSINEIFIFLIVAISRSQSRQESKGLDVLDEFVTSLRQDLWEENEVSCLEATTALIGGVKNQTLWATWAWNSMQLPAGTFYGSSYHLGNFDQCLQVPWTKPELKMQYCLVDVKLTGLHEYDGEMTDPYVKTERYIGKKSRHGTKLNTLSFGVCLPSVCEAKSVAKISRRLYKMSHLPAEEIQVYPKDCQRVDTAAKKSVIFYLYWYVLIILAAVSVSVYFMNTKEVNSTVTKVLHCFSPSRNFDALTETSSNEVMMMHGMRAITSAALVVMHYIIFANVAVINYLDAEKAVEIGYGSYLLHLDACVDTFFVMSGLLHIKGLLSSKTCRPFRVLCKRYLRLLPIYALAVATFTYIFPHLGSGPVWPRMVRRQYDPCVSNWWRNLLMIGHRDTSGEFCVTVSWYICCDYQLTVFGTIIFLLYKGSQRRGFLFFFLAFVLSTLIPAGLTYWQELPGVLYYDFGDAQNLPKNKVYEWTYTKSYTRATAYLLGIAIGYIMTIYKPQDYRKTISKASSILGCIFGISLMLLVLRIGANFFHKEYSDVISALYASVDRSIWSIGICIIIIVCEYGTLPIINDFLSSRAFVPISKLSYLNYMIHSVFMFRNIYSLRAPLRYDFWHLISDGFGYVVISCVCSVILWFILEAPMCNLINLLFDDRKSSKPCLSKEIKSNGVHHNGTEHLKIK